jgi:hypothetical protein
MATARPLFSKCLNDVSIRAPETETIVLVQVARFAAFSRQKWWAEAHPTDVADQAVLMTLGTMEALKRRPEQAGQGLVSAASTRAVAA